MGSFGSLEGFFRATGERVAWKSAVAVVICELAHPCLAAAARISSESYYRRQLACGTVIASQLHMHIWYTSCLQLEQNKRPGRKRRTSMPAGNKQAEADRHAPSITVPAALAASGTACDLALAYTEVTREALVRFAESARQAHNLVNQSADFTIISAGEFLVIVMRHADEYLGLSFSQMLMLFETDGPEDLRLVQRQSALQTVEAYYRHVQELSLYVKRLLPRDIPRN
jgi:hypothetical protein